MSLKFLIRVALSVAALTALGTLAWSQVEGEADDAQGAIPTASYGLFPVEGSGVSGNLNVNGRVEGGTQFVVTLFGIEEGDMFLPVLFRGDCGPDRERVHAMPPVGSLENDPFVSIDELPMSFEEVAQGDYFLYVYPGDDEEGQPVACGEVGAGANE